MDLGFESLLVAIIFLLPGFIATHIRVSRTPIRPPQLSVFQETLASLTTSSLILLIQVGILAFLYWRSNLVKETISIIVKSGVYQYATSNPLNTTVALLSWGFLVLVLSILIGYFEPLDLISRMNRNRLGVPGDSDLWHELFVHAPRQAGYDRSYVRVWLKSGTAYEGWLRSFELPGEKDKPRLFWLMEAQRWETHTDALGGEPSERIPSVLLKYDEDVSSIDVGWIRTLRH